MREVSAQNNSEFPAKAGTHFSAASAVDPWIPAFAGNSVTGNGRA